MPKLPEEIAEEMDLALEGSDHDRDHGHDDHAHQHHGHHHHEHHHHYHEGDTSHLGFSSPIAKILAVRSFHCINLK